MIWLPLLLATLADSEQQQARRGRVQQLKGRLGLDVPQKTFMRRIWDGIARDSPEAIPWLLHAYRAEEIDSPDAWLRSDGVVLRWMAQAIEYPHTDIQVVMEAMERVGEVLELHEGRGLDVGTDEAIDYARDWMTESNEHGVQGAPYHRPEDSKGDSMELVHVPAGTRYRDESAARTMQLAWSTLHEPTMNHRVSLTEDHLLILSGDHTIGLAEELEGFTTAQKQRIYAGPGVHTLRREPVSTQVVIYDLEGSMNVISSLEALLEKAEEADTDSDWASVARELLNLYLNAPEDDLRSLYWIRAQVQDHVRAHGDGALWWQDPRAGRKPRSLEAVLTDILEQEILDQVNENVDEDTELDEDDEVTVATFTDGGQLVELLTEKALSVEGARMRHCIGKPENGHPNLLSKGAVRVFSYRNPEGKPKATLEISTATRQITDLEGPHNGAIHDEAARARMAWLAGPGLTGNLVTNHRLRGVTPAEVRRAATEIASHDPSRLL